MLRSMTSRGLVGAIKNSKRTIKTKKGLEVISSGPFLSRFKKIEKKLIRIIVFFR